MNTEDKIIKRYIDAKKMEAGYVIRIRKDEKDNLELKIYYNGFNMFNYYKGKISINEALFLPNATNVGERVSFQKTKILDEYKEMPENAEKALKEILDLGFKIQIGSEHENFRKLKIEYSSEGSKNVEDSKKGINDYIKNNSKFFENTCITDKNELILKTTYTDNPTCSDIYDLMYKLLKFSVEDARYKKIDLEAALEFDDTDKIIDILPAVEKNLEKRMEIYVKGEKNPKIDYKNSKGNTHQEKQKQQDLMTFLNKEHKDGIYYEDANKEKQLLFSKDITPFEMEYTIYAGYERGEKATESNKKSRCNVKGRLDNVFIDNDTLILGEVKYGTEVIGGTNGIHKHLIDLDTCLEINVKAIEEFEDVINLRNEKIAHINKTPYKETKIKKIVYYIICIYNSEGGNKLSYSDVDKKLTSIYPRKVEKAGLKIEANKFAKNNKNPNKYDSRLLNMDVKQLIERLTNDKKCTTKIFLTDEKFENFEEWVYKK